MTTYYLTGFVRIEAENDADADRKFEAAGLGIEVEVADGVTVDFQGPWDDIEGDPVPDACTCPPDLVARGGFRSDCPRHN